MITEDTLKNAIKNHPVPTGFTWHLHSMDCANLYRLGIGKGSSEQWTVNMKSLVGYPVHVDDRYPRWVKMKGELYVHDEAEYTINPWAMVDFGVYMTRKAKPLHEELWQLLTEQQKNALVPEDFYWYLNPLTMHNFAKENVGRFDAGLPCPHPDDTSYCLLGYRVRNDPDAPKSSHVDILRHSIELSNNDRDWYAMWARKWKCERKEAKNRLLFYVYGPQEAEKTIIKTHYDNLLAGGKAVEAMNVINKFTVDAEAPPLWTSFTGKAKDLLEAKGYADKTRSMLREHLPGYFDSVTLAINERRYLDAMKHLLNLQQRLMIAAGDQQHYEEKRNRERAR